MVTLFNIQHLLHFVLSRVVAAGGGREGGGEEICCSRMNFMCERKIFKLFDVRSRCRFVWAMGNQGQQECGFENANCTC